MATDVVITPTPQPSRPTRSVARPIRANGLGLDEVSYRAIQVFILVTFTALCVIPIIHVVGVSLMTAREAASGTEKLWPAQGTTLAAYRKILSSRNVMGGMRNSFIVTIGGTVMSMIATTTFAYTLSKPGMVGHRFLNVLIVFSMFVPTGLIPRYIIMRTLGLTNTYWAMMIPQLINPFWCILMRNFFEQVPVDLQESAYMEGASEWQVYQRIMLPLSRPAIAAISLFYAVFNWNAWFDALMYITDSTKWPVQVWLQQFITNAAALGMDAMEAGVGADSVPTITIQMATIVFATIPILMVYPFLQKHFTKGIMLGAVKG